MRAKLAKYTGYPLLRIFMSRKAKTAVQDPSSASNAPVPTGILHQLPVDELMKRSYLNYAVSVITSRARHGAALRWEVWAGI